jgi:hypothetical protein
LPFQIVPPEPVKKGQPGVLPLDPPKLTVKPGLLSKAVLAMKKQQGAGTPGEDRSDASSSYRSSRSSSNSGMRALKAAVMTHDAKRPAPNPSGQRNAVGFRHVLGILTCMGQPAVAQAP